MSRSLLAVRLVSGRLSTYFNKLLEGTLHPIALHGAIAPRADTYIRGVMETLEIPATRGNHVNVLQHIQGYLKRDLDTDDKAELGEIIRHYHAGELSLIVPTTLLKHHFRKVPDAFIANSWYLDPYPGELALMNF
jgi:uncharacterized protein YbgA (DUF1722 family)